MNNTYIDKPIVSIIMNCRNGEEYLREAIDSIYAQSYKDWEIIFWDNASSDRSAAIAKNYGSKLRYFKSDRYLTLGMARNMALSKASGRYLAFLDSDDKWLPQKLERQVSLLEGRPDADFVYSNYFKLIMPQTGRLILALRGRQPEGDVFGSFLYYYPVNLQTVMVRTDVVNRLDIKFNDSFEVSEEFDLFMRILLKSSALYIDEPLAVYRIHRDMASRKLIHRYPIEVGRILDEFKKNDASIEQRYMPQIRRFEAKLGYYHARVYMEKGDLESARSSLAPYKYISIKFFILYIAAFFPPSLWRWLHQRKIKSNF